MCCVAWCLTVLPVIGIQPFQQQLPAAVAPDPSLPTLCLCPRPLYVPQLLPLHLPQQPQPQQQQHLPHPLPQQLPHPQPQHLQQQPPLPPHPVLTAA